MLPLVEFPALVQHYAPFFQGVFSAEAWIEFERYIAGLIVSANKTVDGINRLFVIESRHQRPLNRLLTASPFALEALNQARRQVRAGLPRTQVKPKGVLSVDDTLLIHYGQDFEQITKLYDPVSRRYVWAHDRVTLHYSDDATDYPLRFQLWQPVDLEPLERGLRAAGLPLRADTEAWKASQPRKWRSYLVRAWRRRLKPHPELAGLYASTLTLAQALLRAWVQQHADAQLPVTCDDWYTQAEFCRFIDQALGWPDVGTLSGTDRVNLKTAAETLQAFAARLKQEHLAAVEAGGRPVFQPITIPCKGESECYYAYCHTHRLHTFGKQRLVSTYRQADLSDEPAFFISNRLRWQAAGITRIRRHRWPVEVYDEEGQAEGLDQYQRRDFQAIERHVALVAVVYRLLRATPHDRGLRQQPQRQLQVTLDGSAAAWRRATQAQALWCLGMFVSAGLARGQSVPEILAPLIRAVCRA